MEPNREAPYGDTLNREELTRAARYRALALLLLPPSQELGEEIALLSNDVPDGPGEPLRALAAEYSEELTGIYHALLGPSGACRDVESDFEVNKLGGKGPLMADVSGFYRAFAYEHQLLGPVSVDHISAELDFMAWLSFKTAYARYIENAEAVEVCEDASAKFAKAHLGAWVRSFAHKVRSTAEGTYYDRVTAVLIAQLDELAPGLVAEERPDLRRGPGLPVLNEDQSTEECDGPLGLEDN